MHFSTKTVCLEQQGGEYFCSKPQQWKENRFCRILYLQPLAWPAEIPNHYRLKPMFGCIQLHEDLHFSNGHVIKFYLLSQNRGSESIWKVPVSCEQKDNPLIGTVISCGVSVTSSCLLKGTFIVQCRRRLWPYCPKQTHTIRCHWSNPPPAGLY